MKISFNKKILVFGIMIIFFGAAIVPSINGNTETNYIKSTNESATGFPLDDDYVNSYWKFDECSGDTVGDSSTHSYDGARYGATWITNGYSGCALEFDGVDDYVDFTTHAAEIMFNKTDDVIISFYFRSTNGGLIFSATAPWGNNPEFRIELKSNGSLLFYKITQLCGIILYSDGVYNDGDWHHAEYYFNGITTDPTVTLYIDDSLDSKFTHWLCEIENDDYSKTKMGMHSHTSTDYFEGDIDEFKIIKYEQGNEQEPPIISGPTDGEPDVEYEYTFTINDPEGDEVWIKIDWGDGEITDWFGPYESGEPVTVSHSWDEEGAYCVKAMSMDIWGDSKWSKCYEVKIGNQPPAPPTIIGPKCGDAGEELIYTFVSDDYEGHDIYYYVDWGDGTFDDWFGPFASGEETTASHTWDTDGEYDIKAMAKDAHDFESDWSILYTIRIGTQLPPEKPDMDGPRKGSVGIEYGFIFVTTDPEGDKVIYEIDWGDGKSDEEGPISSGEEVIVNHAWDLPATYIIKARARDEFCGSNSEWSEMEIKIPRNRALNFDLINWLFERFPCAFQVIKNLLDL